MGWRGMGGLERVITSWDIPYLVDVGGHFHENEAEPWGTNSNFLHTEISVIRIFEQKTMTFSHRLAINYDVQKK